MKFSKKINRFTATLGLALFTTVATLTLAGGSVLAATVQEEGSIYAGNVTEGVGFTHAGVTAKDNEVVAFEIYYHNLESPVSGMNTINVRIAASLPTTAETVHTVGTTISSDNANEVTDSTTVTTTDATTLQFIPGSVTWKHDTGTNATPNWVTQTIPDSLVTSPSGEIVDPNEQPSNNFAGTVVFEAKVVPETTPPPTPPAPAYSCDKLVVASEANRTVKIDTFNTTATNGATFTNADVNWGDSTSKNGVSDIVGLTHQYAADGTYTISATAHFSVAGKDVTAGGASCQQVVTFSTTTPPTVTPPATTTTTPPAPTALVNTGAGNVFGIFAAVSLAGAAFYRFILKRNLNSRI